MTKIIQNINPLKEENIRLKKNLKRRDKIIEKSDKRQKQEYDLIQNKLFEVETLNKEIEDTQTEMILKMGTIAEGRSEETGNHVKRVALYSELLASYYGLRKYETQILKLASPMHDIGKIAIPDSILKKAGKLTFKEMELMKTHCEIGFEMLKDSSRELFKVSSILAYEHHEKFDGSGYPRGLKGEEIHIYARIVTLADVFDALSNDRVYKKAWKDEDIFDFLNKEKAKHFDPKLIDIFFDNKDSFLEIRDNLSDKFY